MICDIKCVVLLYSYVLSVTFTLTATLMRVWSRARKTMAERDAIRCLGASLTRTGHWRWHVGHSTTWRWSQIEQCFDARTTARSRYIPIVTVHDCGFSFSEFLDFCLEDSCRTLSSALKLAPDFGDFLLSTKICDPRLLLSDISRPRLFVFFRLWSVLNTTIWLCNAPSD